MQVSRGFEYGVQHILSPQSGSLIEVIASVTTLEKSEIQFLLGLGAIYVKNKRATHDFVVALDTYIRIHTKPRRFLNPRTCWKHEVLFSNDDFIVVNKPSGIPVHASVDNKKENLISFLEENLHFPLFVTHRLDIPTRGLLVFAKTQQFQQQFNRALADRQVRKTYRAIVEGVFRRQGLLKHYMEPSPRAPKKVVSNPQTDYLECLLEICKSRVLDENKSELIIELITGRTHQIRSQLAAEGHPIIGDTAYGAQKIFENEKIELEAFQIEFISPIDQKKYQFKI